MADNAQKTQKASQATGARSEHEIMTLVLSIYEQEARRVLGTRFQYEYEHEPRRITPLQVVQILSAQYPYSREHGRVCTAAEIMVKELNIAMFPPPREKLREACEFVATYKLGEQKGKIFKPLEPLLKELWTLDESEPKKESAPSKGVIESEYSRVLRRLEKQTERTLCAIVEPSDFLTYFDDENWTGICTKGSKGSHKEEAYADAQDESIFYVHVLEQSTGKLIAEACVIRSVPPWNWKQIFGRQEQWIVETVASNERTTKYTPRDHWMRTMHYALLRLAQQQKISHLHYNIILEQRGIAQDYILWIAEQKGIITRTQQGIQSTNENFTLEEKINNDGTTRTVFIPTSGKEHHIATELYRIGDKKIRYGQSWVNSLNWNSETRTSRHPEFSCAREYNEKTGREEPHPHRNTGRGRIISIQINVQEENVFSITHSSAVESARWGLRHEKYAADMMTGIMMARVSDSYRIKEKARKTLELFRTYER